MLYLLFPLFLNKFRPIQPIPLPRLFRLVLSLVLVLTSPLRSPLVAFETRPTLTKAITSTLASWAGQAHSQMRARHPRPQTRLITPAPLLEAIMSTSHRTRTFSTDHPRFRSPTSLMLAMPSSTRLVWLRRQLCVMKNMKHLFVLSWTKCAIGIANRTSKDAKRYAPSKNKRVILLVYVC